MITLVIIIIHPIIDDALNIIKGFPLSSLIVQFVFHMAEETFLRSVIPTIPATRHGLPQPNILYNSNEPITGVMAALITVDDSFCIQRDAVILHKKLNCIQDKIHFKGFAEDIGENLICTGIQDHG